MSPSISSQLVESYHIVDYSFLNKFSLLKNGLIRRVYIRIYPKSFHNYTGWLKSAFGARMADAPMVICAFGNFDIRNE
jgi:hypothetical protein